MTAPWQLVDDKRLEALVRAARNLAGFTRAIDAAAALSAEGGETVTERMLTGLERGETKLTLTMAVLMVEVFKPTSGIAWFQPAFGFDVLTRN